MNNSKTEINNGWTVQDEILYREIIEEEVVHGQIIQTYDEILQLNVINNGVMTVEDEILFREILEEEVVDDQIIQTYDEILQLNVAQGPIKEVNKEVKEIKNEDCYDYLYNEIMMANKSSNKQDDWLMDFGDAEDEIDIKIIEDYNRLILEKKLHTSK